MLNQRNVDEFMKDKMIPNGAFFRFESDRADVQHTFIIVKRSEYNLGVLDVNGEYDQPGLPTGMLLNRIHGYNISSMGTRPDNLDHMFNRGERNLCWKYANMIIKLFKDSGIRRNTGMILLKTR